MRERTTKAPTRSFPFAAQIFSFAVSLAAIRLLPIVHLVPTPSAAPFAFALILCHYYYCYYSNEVLAVCRVKSHIVRFSDANGFGCSVSFAIATGLKSECRLWFVHRFYSYFFPLRSSLAPARIAQWLFFSMSLLSVRSFFEFHFCWFFRVLAASVDVALPFLLCFFCIDVVASRLQWTLSDIAVCFVFIITKCKSTVSGFRKHLRICFYLFFFSLSLERALTLDLQALALAPCSCHSVVGVQ